MNKDWRRQINQIQKLKARLATASPAEAQTIQDLITSLELETDPLPTAPDVVPDGEGCKVCGDVNRHHLMNSAQAAAWAVLDPPRKKRE